MIFSNKFFNRTTILILSISFSISSLIAVATPKRAEAIIVFDPAAAAQLEISNSTQIVQLVKEGVQLVLGQQINLKEFVLDPIAWTVAKSLLQATTNDIIRTVSKGYVDPNTGNLSPMFVTNILKHLKINVGTPLAKKIISQIKIGNSPFASGAATLVRNAYFQQTSTGDFWSTHKSTLSNVVKNPEAFIRGDFRQGGIDGLLSMASNPLNNPYGTYYSAKRQLDTQVAQARQARTTELTMNSGFLSSPGTPGTVIKAQLEKALGSGIDSLVSADEIDELIGNIASKLANKAISGVGGLLGLSRPSSGGGASYLNQYSNAALVSSNSKAVTAKIISQIDYSEQELADYISNWTSILNSAKGAKSSLTILTNYTPPSNSNSYYDFKKYNVCSSGLQSTKSAAATSQITVQNVINKSQTAIVKANASKQKLETVRQEAQKAAKTKLLVDVQKAAGDIQNILSITNGVMPSSKEVQYARIQSTPNGSYQGVSVVSPSGAGGLSVSGGTLISQMSTISSNASSALQTSQTCFQNSISISNNN